MDVWPGRPYPVGATPDAEGTNFSLFSEHGDAVDLCLFDEQGAETRLRLPEVTAHRFHGYVPGVTMGQGEGPQHQTASPRGARSRTSSRRSSAACSTG